MRDLKQISFVNGLLLKLYVNGFCIFAIRFMYSGFTRKDLCYILVIVVLVDVLSDGTLIRQDVMWVFMKVWLLYNLYKTLYTYLGMIYASQNLGLQNMIFDQNIHTRPPWKDICKLEKTTIMYETQNIAF